MEKVVSISKPVLVNQQLLLELANFAVLNCANSMLLAVQLRVALQLDL
jgi:hypothetical protein